MAGKARELSGGLVRWKNHRTKMRSMACSIGIIGPSLEVQHVIPTTK